MDIVSHVLTANLGARYLNAKYPKITKPPIIVSGIIPDMGEILIQSHLSQKFGVTFGVYDSRTSDLSISSQIATTWLYDLLHSPMLFTFCFLLSGIINTPHKNLLRAIGFGLIIHVLLDLCTHGYVWALKILFPFSNHRFPILASTIGNWWEWTPKLSLPFVSYGFPIYNLVYIVIILLLTMHHTKCQSNSKQR